MKKKHFEDTTDGTTDDGIEQEGIDDGQGGTHGHLLRSRYG